MSRKLIFSMLTTLATVAGSGVAMARPVATIEVGVDARLAPYGEWRNDPQYGNVFCPHDRQFTPYTSGRYDMQNGTRVWVPATPVGQMTENYGQWVNTQNGWEWIPGTSYTAAPVVVTGGGGGYYNNNNGYDNGYDNRYDDRYDNGRRAEWMRARARAEWERARIEREQAIREQQMLEERMARERAMRRWRWFHGYRGGYRHGGW